MKSLVSLIFFVLPLASRGAEQSAQSFTLDGALFSDAAGTTPLKDNGTLKIQILDTSKTCILYEETQTFDTTNSEGVFNIQVGESTTAGAKRSSGDSGLALAAIFANTGGTLSGKKVTDFTACTAALSAGSTRYLAITVMASSLPAPEVLTPFPMSSMPTAWVAETLQGVGPAGFINVNASAPASLTQAHVENIFSMTNYPILTALLSNGTNGYVQNASNGSVALPAFAATPSSPAAGQIWYDSSGVLKFWNGSSAQTLGVSGSGISSLTVGTGLTPTGAITTSGSIAVDVGTSAGQIVQVQTGGKLPALDGSDLTNVAASSFSSTGSISTSGTLTASGISATTANFNSLTLTNGSSQTVTLQPAASMTGAPLSFTWPSAYPGVAGYILSSDTSGNLSWTAPATGSLTAVSNQASLSNGKVWIGDGSGKAQEVLVTGDVALTNTGSSSVNGIRGVSVTAAPTLTGQVLRYNGASLVPNFVSMTDLRSNVTGITALASSCASNQTLTYDSALDNLTCTNISLPLGQVTGTLPVTNGGTGAVSLSSNQLLLGNGTSAISSLAAANTAALVTNSSGVPSFTSGTTANRLLRTDGTNVTFAQVNLTTDVTGTLAVTNGGTGSTSQTWVDLSTAQTVGGVKTWSSNAIFNGNVGVGTATPSAALHLPAGVATAGGAPLKLTAGVNLTTPEPGAIEFDGSSLFYTDNSNVRHTLAAAGAGLTALTGDVSASGSGSVAATVNSVGGVTATNVASGATAANNATSANTASAIVARDGSGNFAAGNITMGSGVLKGSTSGTLTQTVPASVTSYTITWPSAAPGSSGYVLSSDTSGNLSWIAPATGSLTAVSNQASLADGKIWIGDGSGKAQENTLSGDVSMTDTGVSTVAKVNGVAYGSSPSISTVPVVTGANTVTYETLPIAAGGTGSATQNFVDLTTAQTVAGAKTWSGNALFNGSIGIGTATPDTKLHLFGSSGSVLKIVDGNQGAGKVLTSDANGVASWQSPTGSSTNTLPIYSVRVATSGDTTLSGLQTIDGVALNDGDRVLVKKQTNSQDNGVYTASTGAWTRASDMNTWASTIGYRIVVQEGTNFHGVEYNSDAATGGTLGTTAILFGTVASANNVVALGVNALGSNTSGTYNTAIGYASMSANTSSGFNTALGYGAMNKITSGNGANVAIGVSTMSANTTGYYNTAVGTNSLQYNDVGQRNTAVGYLASRNSTSASYNTTLGYSALRWNLTGSSNTAIGQSALANSTGVSNVALGSNAGYNIYSGDNNVIIGGDTGSSIDGMSNQIIISDGAGNSRIRVDASGNVGIGTTAPRGTLEVGGGSLVGKAAVLNGTATIDFSTGNTQYTNLNCGAYSLQNMKDGGAYMFVIKGTTVNTCNFTGYSDAGTTALTVHMPPDNGPTTIGKHTVFNISVVGTDAYVSWTPGY